MAGKLALKTVLNLMYYSGAQAISRFWLSGLGGILMLHHVRDDKQGSFSPNAGLSITPAFLDRVLGRLSDAGVDFVSMDELGARLRDYRAGSWPDPMIAVTLDDGYRDNLEEAVPVFRRHQVPYTIYVAPGLVDGRAHLWWEDLEEVIGSRSDFHMQAPNGRIKFDVASLSGKRRAFRELMEFLGHAVSETEQRRLVNQLARQASVDPEARRKREIMTWNELADLARDPLCTIGAHTIHHFAVARLSPDDAMTELTESASIIEMEVGRRPRHFAFPYGSPREAAERDFRYAAEAGFDTAVTTRHGVLYPEHSGHLHALPRISLNGGFQSPRYVDTLLSGLPTRLMNRGAKLNVS